MPGTEASAAPRPAGNRRWDELLARFSPGQLDAVDVFVAGAAEFTGAGERISTIRAAGPERGPA